MGGVDVEPDVVALAYVGDFVERIECADGCRASAG